jgi:hypothetical protein
MELSNQYDGNEPAELSGLRIPRNDFSENYKCILAIARYILRCKLDKITDRDARRSVKAVRGLKWREIRVLFEMLYSLRWITRSCSTDPLTGIMTGIVNPRVHIVYADIAEQERVRRERIKEMVRKLRAA